MVKGIGVALEGAFARRLRDDAADTKLLVGDPPKWSGDPNEWSSRSTRMELVTERPWAAEEMQQVIDGDVAEKDFSVDAAVRAHKLFVGYLDGKAELTLRVRKRENGYQVGSRLHRDNESKSAKSTSRYQSTLCAIMHPEWRRTTMTVAYMEGYRRWLRDEVTYELQKGEQIE
ncbi:hypothetical protein N9L68_07575 [bacterium]|nr:hypothetical protein [bacterium]